MLNSPPGLLVGGGEIAHAVIREYTPAHDRNGQGIAKGVALTLVLLIRVRWPSLSLMAFQVGLTAILLASVFVASCRSEVGVEPKHCAIATLCALDPQLRSKLGPLSSDTKGLMQRSKVLKTRLERRELLFVEAAKRT